MQREGRAKGDIKRIDNKTSTHWVKEDEQRLNRY